MRPLPSRSEIARLPADGGAEFNRLIHERSPYLRQHARNPVKWYPWGEEALERAASNDLPIFLSIGYSTCHWCHVMERESFENEEIASILNREFVPIKVDREERPDLDAIYMKATQLATGRGGWPNSLWLTPEQRPFYAGTYFPPEDRMHMPGFRTVLTQLARVWRERRADVGAQADALTGAVQELCDGAREDTQALDDGLLESGLRAITAGFDRQHGGFGAAPKFPPHGALRLLAAAAAASPRHRGLAALAEQTLRAMAAGGIHDHIGGGFHRYATDERWHLPHFEKMLYDNAQLASVYADAAAAGGDHLFREVAAGICDWVLREMTAPAGGFYSALDADSEGEEGKFYLWSPDEVAAVLGTADGTGFCRAYDVRPEGNFHDEATGEQGVRSIAHRAATSAAGAGAAESDAERERLREWRRRLLEARAARVWPHRDEKILTAWNGLMIGALARSSAALGAPSYFDAAERAASFIERDLGGFGGELQACSCEGVAAPRAYLDDYVFLAHGLLELHAVTKRAKHLANARTLMDVVLAEFARPNGAGFYFTSARGAPLLARISEPYDHALPSGNGMAARVLLALAARCEEPRYLRAAGATIEAFSGAMRRAPQGTETLLLALLEYLRAR
ncbi:MAG: thioredoxin domain-containing protein [Planctomycetes bacterium]|nr:thioredoxin domain-containing protein [Planctomycetota bacterium]